MPKVIESINHTTPTTKMPRANAGALPEEVILLQEEMNKTMGHLLMTRVSLDAHQQKQVSTLKWPFVEMRPLRPSRRQRPIVE